VGWSSWTPGWARLGLGTFLSTFSLCVDANLTIPLCYSCTMPYLTRQSEMSLPIVPVAGFKLLDTACLRVCVVPTFVPDAPTVFIKNYPAFLRAARVRWFPPSACVRCIHALLCRPYFIGAAVAALGIPVHEVWGPLGSRCRGIFALILLRACFSKLMLYVVTSLFFRASLVHQVPTTGDIATSGPSFPSEEVEEAEDGEDGDEPERASLMLMRGLLFLFVFLYL
jgi:hypothetical protein